jgi:hypothetical protein
MKGSCLSWPKQALHNGKYRKVYYYFVIAMCNGANELIDYRSTPLPLVFFGLLQSGDIEETLERIQSRKGVVGVIILGHEGRETRRDCQCIYQLVISLVVMNPHEPLTLFLQA